MKYFRSLSFTASGVPALNRLGCCSRASGALSISNRVGVVVDSLPAHELSLTKRAGRVDQSMLLLTTPAYRATIEKESAKARKDV